MGTLGLNRPEKQQVKRKRVTLEDQEGVGRLNVTGMEDGYYYHVVNDVKGKVERMKQRGYEVVENDGKISMGDCNPKEAGSAIQTTANPSDGSKAILMRIPREFKEEDDQYRWDKVDKTEEALYRNEENEVDEYGKARYGKIKTGKDSE